MAPLGQHIKALRENAGMTQEGLAEILGISRPAVTDLEAGKRKLSAEEVIRLSKALHVSADQILGLGRPAEVRVRADTVRESAEVPPRKNVRISVPQKNAEKFKEVLLYVLGRVGAKPNIGETVIYKLLYFIDFDYYEKYEEQLVGATYQRNHFGPTPMEFSVIVEQMIKDRELVRIHRPYFAFDQKKYLPLRDPDLSRLSGRELDMIHDVLNRLSEMGAKQISEYSHKDVPWLTTENGKIIPYEAVFYRTPEYSVRTGGDDGDEVS